MTSSVSFDGGQSNKNTAEIDEIKEILTVAANKVIATLVRGPILSTLNSINNEAVPAVGLAYVAGYAKKRGHAVSMVDGIAEGLNNTWPLEEYPGHQCQGLSFAAIVDRIPADSRVIGLSAMFSGEWPVYKILARLIKARFPQALLVAGGEHITALSEFSLRDCPALDICVHGEGEQTFGEILDLVGAGADWHTVSGISYLDSSGCYVANTKTARIRDVDSIPWPFWPEGYLERFWAAGKSYGVQSRRDMPLMISRGCPFQCTFCSNPNMWTTRYVLRDIEDIVAEIKYYIQRYDISAVQLYDLTAIVKKKFALELCDRLQAENIHLQWSFPSGTRSEALDIETLGRLKAIGCSYMVYAPESGSPATLKRIKKQISLDRLTKSVLDAKKVGLVVRTNLIIGFPFERRRDVFRTVAYGMYLAIRGADEVSINIYSPYPGTELFDELQQEGRITIGDSYFLELTSINSDYSRTNPLTYNRHMGPNELALYRITFMLTNYIIGYILYPRRIIRTIRNIFSAQYASTVLEHRLKDLFSRRKKAH